MTILSPLLGFLEMVLNEEAFVEVDARDPPFIIVGVGGTPVAEEG